MGPPSRHATSHWVVDLRPFMNNQGIAAAPTGSPEGFNIWGNRFPAAQLPAPGTARCKGVPFDFPAVGPGGDNLRCRGQRIELEPVWCSWIHVLCAAERRTEDLVELTYANGSVQSQWLRVSDFWPQTPPRFGDVLAYRNSEMLYAQHVEKRMRPNIWRQRVPARSGARLCALTLPVNAALHVFALTLEVDHLLAGALEGV